MAYTSIAISSGHSTKCQGAVGHINEVAEATRVVDRVAEELEARGVTVHKFHDTVSDDQQENLNRIINWHNSKSRQLDISCHFNSVSPTPGGPVGTEVWHYSSNSTTEKLARQLSAAMAKSGLKDRGSKPTTSLAFLNGTAMPAVLLEVCFVNSAADVEIYQNNFDFICADLADVLGGVETGVAPTPEPEAPFYVAGKCSHFGGPNDTGMAPDEPLAFIYEVSQAPHLFLGNSTRALGRSLNPWVAYCAARWNYAKTPKTMLASSGQMALIRAQKTGIGIKAWPADWGPAGPESDHDTGRVADLSPSLMEALGIKTDDLIELIYPAPE